MQVILFYFGSDDPGVGFVSMILNVEPETMVSWNHDKLLELDN